MILQNTVKIAEYFDREETGDAELFVTLFGDQVRFDHAEGKFYVWAGHYWSHDKTGHVYRLVQNDLAAVYLDSAAQSKRNGDHQGADKLTKRARRLFGRKRIEDILYLAGKQTKIALTGEEWDSNPWLLGVENGVLDLRSGILYPGKQTDYIRKIAPITFAGLDEPATMFEKFMSEIIPDSETLAFVQRLLGYALTGGAQEHVLVFFSGVGRNGKTVLLETLAHVLGKTLAASIESDALMDFKNQNGAGPNPYITGLRGKRLVWASETRPGKTINAGLVKKLTGGDSITARTLRKEPVTFSPTHTMILITNHPPKPPAGDGAFLDRICVVDFPERFVDNPQKPNEHKRDPRLQENLKQEASGVLAWLARGCLAWQAQGLNPPPAVVASTTKYKQEEDELQMFIAACLDKTENQSDKIQSADMYDKYDAWNAMNAISDKPINKTVFGKVMKRLFDTEVGTGRRVFYTGVRLKK